MAGIFNKIVNSMRLNDEEDDDYEFEPDAELDLDFEKEEKPAKPQKPFTKSSIREPDSALLELDDEPEEEPRRRFSSRKSNNVVPMRQNRVNFEVCMVKPSSMADAKELCDILIGGRAVVINMEGVNLELAQRVIDFASGACYSLKGNLQNISRNIFIVTPSNIGLTGDFNTTKSKNNTTNVNINM
ncbi:MAG: cell division protein SepF [Lachnospiraceae bacterium]|nr:cell division protein SepF [Lachnospiraceae bacterium]